MATIFDPWWKPQSISIARLDPATEEPDMTSFRKYEFKPEVEEIIWPSTNPNPFREYSFSGALYPIPKEMLDKLTRMCKLSSKIHRLSLMVRMCKDRGIPYVHAEMSYEAYRQLQVEAHSVFGCNLKRALRECGCKLKIRYKTRNGYWVWMK